MTNCEPVSGTSNFTVTVCLQRGATEELYFKGASLRRAPEVFQRHKDHVPCGRTRSTRASKDTVKGHHKKGICVDANWMFFFFFWMVYMLLV